MTDKRDYAHFDAKNLVAMFWAGAFGSREDIRSLEKALGQAYREGISVGMGEIGVDEPRCHPDLETLCGTCQSYPKDWPAHGWRCPSRGKSVSSDTHACIKYTESPEYVRERRAENSEIMIPYILPKSTGWHWRRRKQEKLQSDTDLRDYDGGLVYFLDCDPFTKIGHTFEKIKRRMEGIEIHNPHELRLWGLVRGDIRLERRFHARFAANRHRNEWFRFRAKVRQQVKDLIVELGGEVYE